MKNITENTVLTAKQIYELDEASLRKTVSDELYDKIWNYFDTNIDKFIEFYQDGARMLPCADDEEYMSIKDYFESWVEFQENDPDYEWNEGEDD